MDSLTDRVWKRGNVWSRERTGTLSQRTYATMIAFWSAVGIAASAVAAYYSQAWPLSLPLLVGALVLAIAGSIIALQSDQPAISVLGYMLVAIPFGLTTGPVVALYTEASVIRIFLITLALVVSLGIAGAVYPGNLESWGRWLLSGLLSLLLISVAAFFLRISITALDWAGVIIFSGYVVYDLNRAMHIPYTHDNAIDSALAIYLDFINIFLRLLELYGKAKEKE